LTSLIVERIAAFEDDFFEDAALSDGGEGVWLPIEFGSAGAPHDYQFLYEQQWAWTEAADARCASRHGCG